MKDKTFLDYAIALSSIATPIIILILTIIGARAKKTFDRKFELEDKLREDRIQIYNEILKPFIILLMSNEAWQSDPKIKNKDKDHFALNLMLSLDYRTLGFKLALMAPDSLVKSYNDLMQFIYNMGENQPSSRAFPFYSGA